MYVGTFETMIYYGEVE